MEHAGSFRCPQVELLYDAEDDAEPPRPLFFDFNLLSTLPDAADYDALAAHILRRCGGGGADEPPESPAATRADDGVH